MFAIIVGVPLTLVLVNIFFGWKAAVLAMPIALLIKNFHSKFRNTKRNSNFDNESNDLKLFWLVVMWGIPLFSVIFDQPDIMRLWAPAIAIAFGGLSASEGFRGKNNAFTGIPRLTFILGICIIYSGISEFIWAFLPFWSWLIYHGSFLLGLSIFSLSISSLVEKHFGIEPEETQTTKAKPPRATNGDRTDRLGLRVWTGKHNITDYTGVRQSHASKLIEQLETATGSNPSGKTWCDLGYPFVSIDFEFAHSLLIKKENDGTFFVQANFSSNPRRMLSFKKLRLTGLTKETVDEYLRLAWRDNWPAIEKRMMRQSAIEI